MHAEKSCKLQELPPTHFVSSCISTISGPGCLHSNLCSDIFFSAECVSPKFYTTTNWTTGTTALPSDSPICCPIANPTCAPCFPLLRQHRRGEGRALSTHKPSRGPVKFGVCGSQKFQGPVSTAAGFFLSRQPVVR